MSSLVAPQVVLATTCDAASNDKVVIMTNFGFLYFEDICPCCNDGVGLRTWQAVACFLPIVVLWSSLDSRAEGGIRIPLLWCPWTSEADHHPVPSAWLVAACVYNTSSSYLRDKIRCDTVNIIQRQSDSLFESLAYDSSPTEAVKCRYEIKHIIIRMFFFSLLK